MAGLTLAAVTTPTFAKERRSQPPIDRPAADGPMSPENAAAQPLASFERGLPLHDFLRHSIHTNPTRRHIRRYFQALLVTNIDARIRNVKNEVVTILRNHLHCS